jgi:integrase/recombinase XerC
VIASCDTSSPTGIRDLALLSLAIDTGLRNAELRNLALTDLDLVSHTLAVVIKGGDEKSAVYSESTAHFLANWIEARKPIAMLSTVTVFCSTGGLTPGEPLTDGGLRCICRAISRRAGLTKVFSPHALRRTMAVLATRSGAPANVLMAMGRWTHEGMLKTYLADINASDGSRYSPVAGLLDAKP